jgi:squalene-associated FAD-dependent desaturase
MSGPGRAEPAVPPGAGARERPHVVVVGGGLAGISAALACADAGAGVTLLDKRARLGGLTWSFMHDGLQIDNGQHVFLRCCTAYLDFLGRIGSAGDVELQPRLDVTVLRPRAARYRASGRGGPGAGADQARRSRGGPGAGADQARLRRDGLRAPLHLARSLLRYGLISVPDRARLGPAALALARLDLDEPALDEQTFEQWLRAHGQSQAAISALWDLICLPTVNLPARQASLAMAAKVFQTGLLTESSAGDIGWSRVPLGALHGEKAAAALGKAGVEMHLADTVTAVRPVAAGPDGGTASRRFVVCTSRGELAADGVVVAVPHYRTEDVLPPGALPEHVRPSELASSPIVNVHVHFDRRVTDLPLAAALGSPAQWIFDRTASSGADRGQYLAVSISAADDYIGTRPDDLGQKIVEALVALFPAAREAKVLRTFVTREHNATFRASPRTSGQRAPARTRLPGLAVAGAWTATGWPPTMEGAVRSGLAAARTVLAATGQRTSLPRAHLSSTLVSTQLPDTQLPSTPLAGGHRPQPEQFQEVM